MNVAQIQAAVVCLCVCVRKTLWNYSIYFANSDWKQKLLIWVFSDIQREEYSFTKFNTIAKGRQRIITYTYK